MDHSELLAQFDRHASIYTAFAKKVETLINEMQIRPPMPRA